jgi:hypothetical protein
MTRHDRAGENRWLYLMWAAFLVAGIGLLTGGLLWFRSTIHWVRSASSAQGRIQGFVKSLSEEGRDYYYPLIAFKTPDGRQIEFRSKLGRERPTYQVNDPVEVLYDPRRPDKAVIRSFSSLWLFPGILTAIGLGFAGISTAVSLLLLREGARSLAEQERREETAARLRSSGRKLTLKADRVFLDTRSSRDGLHPYRIICRWRNPETGRAHVFESESIWFNPQEYIRETIDVYIDPESPKVYSMDTSFLPRLADE